MGNVKIKFYNIKMRILNWHKLGEIVRIERPASDIQPNEGLLCLAIA